MAGGFELDGALVLDLSALEDLKEKVQETTGAGATSELTVTADTSQATEATKKLSDQATALGDQLKTGHTVKVDTTEATRSLDGLQSKYDAFRQVMGSTAMIGGLGAMAAGAMIAVPLISDSMKAATSDQMMEKSTRQVFGSAGEEYVAQAQRMQDATGFLARETEKAQININKSAQLAGLGTVSASTGKEIKSAADQTDLRNKQNQSLTDVSANLAATSGLPQYANNIEAVSNAVAAGLKGTEGALLDFGINLDAVSVLAIPVNKAFKDMGEAITPAQMAQARYNYIMDQTASITGAASDSADDVAGSMRQFGASMEGAKSAVGEVLMPIAKTIADFVANIPKPLLEAGVWIGIGAGMAAMAGGAVVALNAVRKALADLGAQSLMTAAEVKASSAAQGTGGLPDVLGRGKGLATGEGAGGGALGKLTTLLEGAGMAKGGLAAGWGYSGTGTMAAGLSGGMVLAAPAAVAAWMATKWSGNEQKREEAELDAATERYRMNAVRVAKITGASIPEEAAAQAARQGVSVEGSGGMNINITLNDRTTGGVYVTDPQSFAPSNY